MRKTNENKAVKNCGKNSESKSCSNSKNGAKSCGKNTKNCK